MQLKNPGGKVKQAKEKEIPYTYVMMDWNIDLMFMFDLRKENNTSHNFLLVQEIK